MAKMEGVETLVRKLQDLSKSKKYANAKVTVGYLAPYSTYVHENMTAHHPVGSAKFLEIPTRQNRQKYADIVAKFAKQKQSIADGLMAAGLALQFDSQELVPVDTGALKASAFTRVSN